MYYPRFLIFGNLPSKISQYQIPRVGHLRLGVEEEEGGGGGLPPGQPIVRHRYGPTPL